MGTSDFLDPAFAFDGNDATFFQSAVPPKAGDHFTADVPKRRGRSTRSRCSRASTAGAGSTAARCRCRPTARTFTTVATLDKGRRKAVLKDNRVRAVRIRAAADQAEPLVVRAINLRLMVEVSGIVRNPARRSATGMWRPSNGDAEFAYPIGTLAAPVINRGFTPQAEHRRQPCSFAGPISGTGTVEIHAGGAGRPARARRQGGEHHARAPGRSSPGGSCSPRSRGGRDGRHGHRRRHGRRAWSGTATTRLNDAADLQLLAADKAVPRST